MIHLLLRSHSGLLVDNCPVPAHYSRFLPSSRPEREPLTVLPGRLSTASQDFSIGWPLPFGVGRGWHERKTSRLWQCSLTVSGVRHVRFKFILPPLLTFIEAPHEPCRHNGVSHFAQGRWKNVGHTHSAVTEWESVMALNAFARVLRDLR